MPRGRLFKRLPIDLSAIGAKADVLITIPTLRLPWQPPCPFAVRAVFLGDDFQAGFSAEERATGYAFPSGIRASSLAARSFTSSGKQASSAIPAMTSRSMIRVGAAAAAMASQVTR